MPQTFNVIDLFAGPGGLGEGFSAYRDRFNRHPYRIAISAEKDPAAHATLSLRKLGRLVSRDGDADDAKRLALVMEEVASTGDIRLDALVVRYGLGHLWTRVTREALNIELGTTAGDEVLSQALRAVSKSGDASVLIGGPPCQAYSLVGRARNRGKKEYSPEADDRHFLYRHYLKVLSLHRPAMFIMENVKGILSSKVGGSAIFPRILDDLASPDQALLPGVRGVRYQCLPLVFSTSTPDMFGDLTPSPTDYVVRTEQYGIPQARHRVIIVGIRSDVPVPFEKLKRVFKPTTLRSAAAVLGDLPPLRSGVSDRTDSDDDWAAAVKEAREGLVRLTRSSNGQLSVFLRSLDFDRGLTRAAKHYRPVRPNLFVARWYRRRNDSGRVWNHETRTHMTADLARYLYCAAIMAVDGRSPTSGEFPASLAPDHANWASGHFADRFRVVHPDRPSGTVTSHLGKDGHQFIHWDAEQCRSLTVREAARLQTFPDDYLFAGPRTSQFTQVGNAVPPLLAAKIAKLVAICLGA